jgi:hypothetical protein
MRICLRPVSANLPVQLWGTDAQGKPFMQSARTVNISAQGGVLEGVAFPVRVGEIIRVQCGDQKANFQVMWVGQPGTRREGQIGIKSLVSERFIWTVARPEPRQDTFNLPRSADRRTEQRQGTALNVEIREDGAPAPVWATTEDISIGGCFVQMLAPFKAGTALQVHVWIGSEKIWSRAVVRTSEPGVGFGLEFTYMPDPDLRILKTYLESLPVKSRAGKAGPTVSG